MADQTQLRFPGDEEFAWYVLDLHAHDELWCWRCGGTIPAGGVHARSAADGHRYCPACIDLADVGRTMGSTEANRRQRHDKVQASMTGAVQTLLDGLEVGSIRELKRLVDSTRTAEARYMRDRGGTMSAAIGMARLALQQGDPEKAARVLDEACGNLHRDHYDACVADGHDPAEVEMLLGPRDRS